jgi:hypothetical protein
MQKNCGVHDGLMALVKHCRRASSEKKAGKCVLEVRLGRYDAANTFMPGFRHDNTAVVQRLMRRLTANCRDKPNWKAVDQYLFLRSYYPDGIRCTHAPDRTDVGGYQTKRRVAGMDLTTNRPHHMCVSLMEHKDVDASGDARLTEMLKRDRPESMRLLQRASFVETVQMGQRHLQLRYDISKVSPSKSDKKHCTSAPCNYHFGLKVESALSALGGKEEEDTEDAFIVEALLARMRAMLGTHHAKSHKALPTATFHLLVQ